MKGLNLFIQIDFDGQKCRDPRYSVQFISATVYGKNAAGEEMIATIIDFNNDTATLDFNHPMAGKSLNFEINVVEIID